MVPLKLLEALVDQTASRCATFSKTGANYSERFTPNAVSLFDKERDLSKGCVPLGFFKTSYYVSCLVERVKQRQADVTFPLSNLSIATLVVTRGGLRSFSTR